MPRNILDASKSLHGHIESFREYLNSKERTSRYIKEVVNAITEVVDGCNFNCITDISPQEVKNYLDGRRARGKGISKRRYNFLLNMVKYFLKWAVKSNMIDYSPLEVLEALDNPDTDRRHPRRSLPADEVRRLLEAAKGGPEKFGLTGYERYLLYRFSVETGLRVNEIRTLTVQSFNFDDLTVTVKAGYSKHRRTDTQPLRPQLAVLLKQSFENKLPNVKAFGGRYKRLTDKTAEMIRFDLANTVVKDDEDNVVIEPISYGDEDIGYADFHALRHTFITALKSASRGKAQSLARHTSSKMTDRYTHKEMEEDREALEVLPDYSLPSTSKLREKKDGTND